MQSFILMALMLFLTSFATIQFSRNNIGTMDSSYENKASNVAANIFQYNDMVIGYMRKNESSMHLTVATNPGNIELITKIDSTKLAGYSQKSLVNFLDYQSVAFNYAKVSTGESMPLPIYFMATSWSTYSISLKGYKQVILPEVMGQLGQDLGKRLFQGDSTYWTVPWVFSQNNCNIQEVYTHIPNDDSGTTARNSFKTLFNLFCTQLKVNANYQFLTYVYLQPVYGLGNL